MTDVFALDQIDPEDRARAGGKAVGLVRLIRAGLPVPAGVCLRADAGRRLPLRDQPELAAELLAAYHRLGGGPVAVRSSAVPEDAADQSWAGQFDTLLDIQGDGALLDAVDCCRRSAHAGRADAYRRLQGAGAAPAVAVLIQRMIAAEVAGVLFTRDPLKEHENCFLVEATPGPGADLVAGRVPPDRYRIHRATGAVRERLLRQPTERPCFDDRQLAELADLGRRVEAAFGGGCDVEWAWAAGQFWLLQARPITTDAAERERLRRAEIAALTARAGPEGTAWARINLAEAMPEPTPMTWAITRRLVSGRGGLGLMYRDLGFRPDPVLDETGAYDLIAGRTYCNLSREPGLYANGLPLTYPFAELKANPHLAGHVRARLDLIRAAGAGFWLRLPAYLVRSGLVQRRLGRLEREFAQRFREAIMPPFVRETHQEMRQDYAGLDTAALRVRLDEWIRRTLVDFARDSLKPGLLAAGALTTLEQLLTGHLSGERIARDLTELARGVHIEPEADLGAGLRAFAAGTLDGATFLHRFGHRGPREMELAAPRWAEIPEALDQLRQRRAEPPTASASSAVDPESIAHEARLSASARARFHRAVATLHTSLGLRETARHHLMRGYAVLRRLLVELDRRFGLEEGIFFLEPNELTPRADREALRSLIRQRRHSRALALGLEVPPLIFSDDLEAIGRPLPAPDGVQFQGVPLSPGVAEGLAFVLDQPDAAILPAEPFILICPSTDAAWAPLFVAARGVVMETGGLLSHGAIVAREFALPAVSGLPGIRRRLRTGHRVRVDGGTGLVTLLDASSSAVGAPPLLS